MSMHLFRKYGGGLQSPRNVGDVDITLLFAEPPIDKGVEKLVKALVILDFDVEASCEGHMQPNRHHYPWVFGWNLGNNRKLHSWIEQYNDRDEVKWKIERDYLRSVQEAESETDLRGLQASSDRLAEHLFENYYFHQQALTD